MSPRRGAMNPDQASRESELEKRRRVAQRSLVKAVRKGKQAAVDVASKQIGELSVVLDRERRKRGKS